jgi:NAD-dependent DNA ligase
MTIKIYKPNIGSYAIAMDNFFAYLITEKPDSNNGYPTIAHYVPIRTGEYFLVLETSNEEKYTRFPFKILYNEIGLHVNNIDASHFLFCNVSDKIKNKSFCITGELTYSRQVYERIIELNGGHFKTTITKNLNYLITNKITSSSKFKKAKEYNIPIINETEFLSMF